MSQRDANRAAHGGGVRRRRRRWGVLPRPSYAEVADLGAGTRFLVQFDIRHVGMPLGFSALTLMWRALAVHFSRPGVPSGVWYGLWYFTAGLASFVFGLLVVRATLFPHLLYREFQNSVLTNIFASPCIVAAGLIVAVPPVIRNETVTEVVLFILLAYHMLLALVWYGDWLYATRHTLRRISALYFMAVVNFFTLSSVAAACRKIELARYLFMLGCLFWLLIFISAFSFLSNSFAEGTETPSPTLFLFLAPPASAALSCLATSRASAETLLSDKLRFFAAVTCFTYLLLLRLFAVFYRLRFTVAWWAYVFPLGNAGALAVELTSVYDDARVAVLVAVVAVTVCMLVVVLVSGLTARAVWKGELPKSELALRMHFQHLQDASVAGAAADEGKDGPWAAVVEDEMDGIVEEIDGTSASALGPALPA
jgi:tellurite resistance protein